MLNLGAKLLAAGLVSKEQIEKSKQDEIAKQQAKKARIEAGKARQEARAAAPEKKNPHSPRGPRVAHASPRSAPVSTAASSERRDNRPAPTIDFDLKLREKHLKTLKSLSKTHQYEVIRRWVERNRFDKGTPTEMNEDTERYFFQKVDGQVTWLTLPRAAHNAVTNGKAAILSFMSSQGISHCAIAKEIAEDVAEVFPYWLRVLNGNVKAGLVLKAKETAPVEETQESAPKIL